VIPKQILDDRAIRVLLIACDEAEHALVTLLSSEFEYSSHTIDWASSYDEGLQAITAEDHDVYLVDSDLGTQTGLELIAAARSDDQPAPFILLTQAADHAMDIEALDLGAGDFIVKHRLDADRLERSPQSSSSRHSSRLPPNSAASAPAADSAQPALPVRDHRTTPSRPFLCRFPANATPTVNRTNPRPVPYVARCSGRG
jgi:DNA-binding NtrC family response regulator